ncbi:MAG: amidohydrolase, partial [Clostridia bacterium]|nr:amidohydrolase [Clostridia bacterium]
MELKNKVLELSKEIEAEIIQYRRFLHENPELHLDLPITTAYVKERLTEMGYEPVDCGKSGIVVVVGKGEGKVFMIRGDMDALPVKEEADLTFKSNNENMHACGHDLHTAMLLGAAKVLKKLESDIPGKIKLMFQPGEETLSGAKEMIENGLLENPKVDAALMIHAMTGFPVPEGKLVYSEQGAVTAASDTFEIVVQGKGGHGAMPDTTIDPINVAVHIHQMLQSINSREISPSDTAVLTIGSLKAGDAANVIPDKAILLGTIRTFSEKTREFIKDRLVNISINTALGLRAKAEVNFLRGCPSVVGDEDLSQKIKEYLKEIFKEED